jgi:hypothetical protein
MIPTYIGDAVYSLLSFMIQVIISFIKIKPRRHTDISRSTHTIIHLRKERKHIPMLYMNTSQHEIKFCSFI